MTVPQVIEHVYGDTLTCASKLGVKRPAVSNWKAFGQFPARLVGMILRHAQEAGKEITVDDIPASEQVRKSGEANGAAA